MNSAGTISRLRLVYLPVLFLLWFLLLGWQIKRSYWDSGSEITYFSLGTGIRTIPTDSEWMTIYHNGKKLGYSVFSVQNRGEKGYIIKSAATIKAAIAGLEANIIMENKVRLDTTFKLQSFDFKLTSDQYNTHISGEKFGTEMRTTIIHGADSVRKTFTVPQDLYTYLGIQPLISWQGIREGERLRIPAYDPVSMETAEVEIIHEGKETVRIREKDYKLNRIKVIFRGIPATRWLDDNGLTYREESIMGLMMERTSSEEALNTEDMELTGIDLLDVYAVIPDVPIRKPEKLTELTLQIDGIDPSYFLALNSPRQMVISENPLILRIRPVGDASVPVDRDKHLAATDMIQPSHEMIRSELEAIRKTAPGGELDAQYLREWVYKYLRKFPVVSLSSATEILTHAEGDCSEHTILYTSLSRGAGIPTRIHMGLAYVDGKFFYHAWPVVYMDGQWIPIDPTLDQPMADATHIAILESDMTNLPELIPALGRISIKVVNQNYSGSPQ